MSEHEEPEPIVVDAAPGPRADSKHKKPCPPPETPPALAPNNKSQLQTTAGKPGSEQPATGSTPIDSEFDVQLSIR